MSLLRDVERGDEAEDSLAPLLGPSPGLERLRPARPRLTPYGNFDEDPAFMNQLGPSSEISTPDTTPLGDTEDIFPRKWRRSDRRLRRLNTELLEAINDHDIEEVEKLLKNGANPNATCRLDLVSACHMSALSGGDALGLLIKFGAEKYRLDRLGRTPLHLAAFAGNSRQVAILLDFPEDMQKRVDSDDLSSEAEEEVKKLCPVTKELVNIRCNLGNVETILPKNWKDNIDHNCMAIKGTLPILQPGFTPLHVAASCARTHCVRLLLAAGADPNICDAMGRTALDVAGSGYYYGHGIAAKCFTEVVRILLNAGGKFYTMKARGQNIETPLHTAVLLENIESIEDLLNAGVSIACLDSSGQTPLHLCVKNELEDPLQILANYAYKDADPMSAMVDVKDYEGHTVLQASVEASWVPGVCIALEAGADVAMRANDGETPIHSAAALGNLDVLNEILSVSKQRDLIDCQNQDGETALFKAINHGHLNCVEAILNEGASTKITLPGDVNVLHVAAEKQHNDILNYLLNYDKVVEMINYLTAPEKKGFGPIHYAVLNNNVESLKILLSKNADIRLRTTSNPHKSATALHIAAVRNFQDVAKAIVENDKTTIYEVDAMGWYPLHSASHHGSRDVIMLLLKEGADLSGYTDGPKKFRRTAIDMILNNLSKPTDFMEEVFDTCISSNCQNFQDSACEITVDYRILMPSTCEMEQIKVIKALLKTGNRYGQKRLLLHPLVESFLYLKWKALLPFFYTIIFVYSLFVASLTIFCYSVFYFKDIKERPPKFLLPHLWARIMYGTVLLTILQEVLYMNVKSLGYLLQLETWIKFSSIILAAILPPTVVIALGTESEWPRHVATCALLLSWIELMFLLSRFPNWGYYVLMFGKVASNVIKILLTFGFLVVGFSLSFMIQFRSDTPFDGPWAAMVKTMVMMTSEFDYGALFDEEHSKELATSLIIVRLIFLIFLILAAIVLMNLMVGVAVNDINDLEVLGNIRRLGKQVEFLSILDNLVYNTFFNVVLPRKINSGIKNKKKVCETMVLCPGRPRWGYYKTIPSRIRNAILDKVQKQNKQIEEEHRFEAFSKLMQEIHEALTSKDTRTEKIETVKGEKLEQKMKYDEVMNRLNSLDECVTKVEDKVISYVHESTPVEQLHVKVDQLSLEIEGIKSVLTRLEKKLSQ
ncbi:transient receptor potential channel pyrexia-like [Aricia agestis]|uniref:transient receptor potential channel pyrexia-like n=1 Tax=Aricia agestis TaxID=91739 RepID=UPI001C2024E6|nr:transient receptor potential channel pyrexia-like [Aricia agestis]